MMREAVTNVTKSAPLDVLLDGIEGFFLAYFHLSVRPARDFDDHVEYPILHVSMERDVVERRHDRSILLHVNTVL